MKTKMILPVPADRAITRKHCGRQEKWEIGLDKLRLRSGATTTLPRFRSQLRDFAACWERRPPRASSRQITETSLSLPKGPDEMMTAIIRAEMPGYDPHPIYADRLSFTLSSDVEVKFPPTAIRGYCRKRAKHSPKLR